MKEIRITGVPEHFNIFWKKLVQAQPYQSMGYSLVWLDEPKGSGAMNLALREGKTEIAVVLSESFVKDKIEGNPSLITDWYVASPLTWGIHRSSALPSSTLQSIENPSIAISRLGSGSHLMAFLLAKREGWDYKLLNFDIINDLKGAIANAKAGVDQLFLWEKFTTNPYVIKGVFERIGEIPTPWPCFVTAVNENFLNDHEQIIRLIQQDIKKMTSKLIKSDAFVTELAQEYNLIESDVKEWLSQTDWATDNSVSLRELENIMRVLMELGLIKHSINAENLVSTNLCTLID